MSEFCEHGRHESHYCGSCYLKTIRSLTAQLEQAEKIIKNAVAMRKDWYQQAQAWLKGRK